MSLANSSNGTHPSGRYRADRTGHERTRNTEDIQANMRKKRLARGHASEQEHDTSQAHPGKKSYEPDSVRIYMQQKAEQRQKAAKLEAQLAEQKRQQVTSSLRQLDSFRKRQGKIIRQRADKHNATHSSNAHSLRGSLKSSVDRPNLTKDLPSVHQARNARVSHINMSGPEKNAPQFTQHSGPTLPGAHINANASSAHHKLQSLVHGAMALQERIKRCLPDAHCDETSADTSDSDSESMTSIAPTLPAKSIDRLPFQQSGASGILLDTGLQNLRVGHREALPKPRHNGLSHNHTNIREDEESESVAVPGHSLASDYPEFGFSVPTSSMSASDGIMRSTFKSKLHSSITSNNAINPSGPISILRRYELLRKQKHNGVQVTSEMKLHNRAPNSANSSWATPRDKAEGEDDYYNIINVIRRKCPQKNLVVSKQQEELPKKWSSPYNRRSQTSSEFKGRENIDPQLRTAGSLIVGSICIDTDEDESSLQHVGSEYSEVSAQRKGIESITSRLRENLDENSMGTRHTPLKNMPSLEPPKENPKAFNIAKHSLSKSPNSQSLPGAGPHISNSGSLPQRKENFGKDSTMPTSGTASSSGKSPRKRRVKHTQDHGTFAESRHALDQHQRLSPTSLSRKLTAEMNLLEAVEESRWQLAELERHEGMGVTGLQVKELGAALLEKERHYDMDLDMARKAREIRAAQSSASNVQNRPALPLQEPPVSVLDLDSEVQDAYSNNTFEEISSFPIPGDGEMFDTSIAIPPSVSQTHGQESSMVHAERDDISEMGTNDERVIGRQPAGDDISMIASEYDQQNFTPSAAHSDNIIPNNLTRTTTQTDADSLKSDTHFAASVRSLPPMHQSQNAHRPDHPKERGMERLVVKLREARDAVQLEKLERKEHKLKLSRKIAEILIAKKQESKEWRSRLAIEEAQIATMLDDVLLDPETHANSNQAVAPSKKSNSFHSTVLAEKAQKLDKQTGSRSDRPFSVSTDSASKRLPNTIRRDLSDNSTPSISNNSVVESPSNGFEEEDIDEPLTDIVASAAEPDDDFLSEIPTAEDISEISELVDTKSRKTVVASSNSYDDEALEDIASVDHHDRKTPPQNEHSLRISQIVDEGSAHILRRIETLRQQLSERKTRADLLSRAKLEKQQNVKEKLKVTEKSLKRELMVR
ncbi:hypothetical protein DFS34DRAFT_182497 [Phlyctochytrium arcticum]|nr:hypothetical protein DFS34DRAFT_182497 [Phlyctochytrium arcticum]